MRTTTRRSSAFTLIELLVVILILAILAALIVPGVINRTGDAKRAKAASDISTLGGMLQTFRLDTGRYPTTEEGLSALRTPPSDVQNWKGPYSQKPISPDPWGNEYIYEYPGSTGDDSYTIISYGSDGQPGGTGEAIDVTEGEDR
ncbi:MAG: type II secretion system major pseudopilin GspG [Fimbriimonas sp.]